ncbi:hypothetical protein Q4595_03665 [Wenyingzhuangia sp. 1_MG-2023]|nr:hypothetical protein [Wenyingzhuangia sp. 1_MG-2023]
MTNICDINLEVQLKRHTFCRFELLFFDRKIQLNFPQLLQLRAQVMNLTNPKNLTEIIDNENFVLLFVADKKHLLFVEIPNLLLLKEELEFFFSMSA